MSAALIGDVQWRRRFGLEPLDLWFAALRGAALLAGILWVALAPGAVGLAKLATLGVFFAFSVILYAYNALRPGRLATLYRVALLFDLVIVFVLVRLDGGFASDLYLALILLIALHAFYFGLGTGLVTAGAAIALYAMAGSGAPPMPGFVLRVGFFAVVGICMGMLSEQARERREVLERQQEWLVRSERLATVGEIAAGLAHELRNPLAGIAGALHVLSSQFGAGHDSAKLLTDVQAQIGRMNKTLTDLLQHARPGQPQRIAVDINALLEQTLRFLPRDAVEIARHYDQSLPPLLVDPNLLHQAFLNILVNAQQAMPQGGSLTVVTGRGAAGSAVEVRIGDTGSGIAADQLPRIFQPFFTTKSQGTGLGLPIAARIVEQHGGRIRVASEPGRGSVFTITLPADARPAPPMRSKSYAFEGTGR